MPMLRKPLEEITPADLEELCRSGALEDEQADFKESIPHKEAKDKDPWRDVPTLEARKIKDYGRDQLLGTLVAFANSYGGDLIVGVREADGSQPGRAEATAPLPDCAEAAHRLSQQINACIDPPLTSVQVRGVVTGDDGSGVIILRVGRSRSAPHRLTTTKECYHRVRHETLAMTMRQIQDATFNVGRGLDVVDKRLNEIRGSYETWARRVVPPATHRQFRMHFAAVPTTNDAYLEKVHNVDAVRPGSGSVYVQISQGGRPEQLVVPFNLHQWSPVLRGSETENRDDERAVLAGVYCDGVIRYEFARSSPLIERGGGRDMYALYPGWYFAALINLFESVRRFRVAAGATAVEYALETEISTTYDLPVLQLGSGRYGAVGRFSGGRTAFPRYVIGAPDAWQETFLRIYRDFWNAAGVDAEQDVFIVDPL
jgi:hypothetical protein